MNPTTTYYPSTPSSLPDPISGVGTLSQVLIFLILVAAGCMLVVRYFQKRNHLGSKTPKTAQKLQVQSSHPLGKHQYLVVVQFGPHDLLLGVSPTHIQTLCSTPSPSKAGAGGEGPPAARGQPLDP